VTTSYDVAEPAIPEGDGGLVRLRLDLQYDGTEFAGWARQPGLRTVQETLESAFATVLRLAVEPRITVAGRTDAGVHAIGQVAHIDLAALPDLGRLERRLAGLLPDDVVVTRVSVAAPDFHARFGATGRRYRYRIADGRLDPLRRRDIVQWKRPLDVEAMSAAARHLVGQHDFAAYCRRREGATTVRTLHSLAVHRDVDGVVVVEPYADAFCHNQVRSMVGALLAVGDGRRPVDWPLELLRAAVRDPAVTVAPAHGLILVAVEYPPDHELAEQARRTRQRRDQS
jgi:tRNA pseudouridine38-40 synthase